MRLWQDPPRALPVRLRAFGGETLSSYVFRLAKVNGLPTTAVLRAIGDVKPGSCQGLLSMDGALNRAAQDRLAILTQTSRSDLIQTLPSMTSFTSRPLPTDRPAVFFRGVFPHKISPACTRCVRQRTSPPALLRLTPATMVCRPHRRWLDGTQYDLGELPAVLGAFHHYRALLQQHEAEHPGWIERLHHDAFNIVLGWIRRDSTPHPDLTHRWNVRAERLDVHVRDAVQIVTFPETVTLIKIISDPEWRMRLAVQPSSPHLGFYRWVARSLGIPQNYLIKKSWYGGDPLRVWIATHQWNFRHAPHDHENGKYGSP